MLDLGQDMMRLPRVSTRVPLLMYLLWLCFLIRSESVRPSDHGLTSEKNPAVASPAMASFFLGSTSSSDVAMPEARNATDPIWSLAADAARGGVSSGAADGRHRVRTVLLTTGVVGGVVGVGLLTAAAFVYVVQARRSKAAAERRNDGPAPFHHMNALEPV